MILLPHPFPTRIHLAAPKEMSPLLQARDAAKHPAGHRTALHPITHTMLLLVSTLCNFGLVVLDSKIKPETKQNKNKSL